ncbi:MAG: ankyrin repeat domain-containing protein [Alphaproteobacteria bacterium]|nr:ankyrin repeat domain-containing protein [Alphaproteobacteria bacterium]
MGKQPYKWVIIVGPDHNENLISSLREHCIQWAEKGNGADSILLVGNGQNLVSKKSLEQLKDKIDGSTRIDIWGHALNTRGSHTIHLLDDTNKRTSYLFEILTDLAAKDKNTASPSQLYIHLWSCFAGAAMPDYQFLPSGSLLIIHGSKSYPTLMKGNIEGIQTALTENKNHSPYVQLFEDAIIRAETHILCLPNNQRFVIRPPKEMIQKPEVAIRYLQASRDDYVKLLGSILAEPFKQPICNQLEQRIITMDEAKNYIDSLEQVKLYSRNYSLQTFLQTTDRHPDSIPCTRDYPIMAWLVEKSKAKDVKLLIKHGANINKTGPRGNYLHQAIQWGEYRVAEVFIAYGIDIQAKHLGKTPLEAARVAKNQGIFNMLQSYNADSLGWKMHYAIQEEDHDLLTSLCSSPKAGEYLKQHGGMLFSTAVSSKNTRALSILLSAGAHPDALNGSGEGVLHEAALQDNTELVRIMFEAGANINLRNPNHLSPLHYAAKFSGTNLLEALIDKGALLDATDNLGRTALHYAAIEGNDANIEFILKRGTDINLINQQDTHGNTALHMALDHEEKETAALLIERGANVNLVNHHDTYPLHLAAKNGMSKIIINLLKHNALVNCVNTSGCTPLHLAAAKGKDKATQQLLNNGADPSIKDKTGNTALHHAIQKNKKKTIDTLIKHNPNLVNIKNDQGNTPLHIAIKDSNVKSVQRLLEAKPDITITNNQGNTALNLIKNESIKQICFNYKYKQPPSSDRTQGRTL